MKGLKRNCYNKNKLDFKGHPQRFSKVIDDQNLNCFMTGFEG